MRLMREHCEAAEKKGDHIMDAMAIVMECPLQAQSRKRYVLTNGLDVYELRRMDELELMVAQQNALLHGRGELWWDGAD